MVSHFAALEELLAPHFLCGGIFVFKTYNSCTPTASQVLITADILCGSKTFSKTTVRSNCLFCKTDKSFSFLSGVIYLKITFLIVNCGLKPNTRNLHFYNPIR